MPYTSNQDLPRSVREHLPAHAQDIFRSAFKSLWRTYGETDSGPHGGDRSSGGMGGSQEVLSQAGRHLGAARVR